MWTPRKRASRRYSPTSRRGSTTAATPARSSPTRYDAQPRSSWISWRKIIAGGSLAAHDDPHLHSGPDVQRADEPIAAGLGQVLAVVEPDRAERAVEVAHALGGGDKLDV